MMVVVDTCVWSLALRRRKVVEDATIAELRTHISSRRAVMFGCIRQEILSGIADNQQFTRTRDALRSIEDLPLETADYERAAEFYNVCRRSGIAGSPTDLLICAIAERRSMSVFSTDHDFTRYASVIPVSLHQPQ